MQQALERWRDLGSRSEEAMALTVLSGAAQGRGDIDLAVDRAGQALVIFRALGHVSGELNVLSGLGRLGHRQGDDRRACSAYHEGLRLWSALDERWSIADPDDEAVPGLSRPRISSLGRCRRCADRWSRPSPAWLRSPQRTASRSRRRGWWVLSMPLTDPVDPTTFRLQPVRVQHWATGVSRLCVPRDAPCL